MMNVDERIKEINVKIAEFKSYKVFIKRLAAYLGEEETVIENIEDIEINVVEHVNKSGVQYYTHHDEYVENNDNFQIIADYIEEAHECADMIREVAILEAYKKYAAGEDQDIFWDDDEIDLDNLEDYHEGFDSYLYGVYTHTIIDEIAGHILNTKNDIDNTVEECITCLVED